MRTTVITGAVAALSEPLYGSQGAAEKTPLSAPAVASLSEDMARIQQQHQMLKAVLAIEPALASMVFQGHTLAQLATEAGLKLLQRAVEAMDYDAVALNHGIKRLRLDGYAGEVIWDHPGSPQTFIESDAVTQALEQHAERIRDELLAAVDRTVKFPDSDSLTNAQGLWSYRSFYDKSGMENRDMHGACPTAASVIKGLRPNLTFGFAFASVLNAQTTIAPHKGSTSLRQRYHLGIKIPKDGISRIRIGRRWTTWKEGKAFGFNDAIEHEVEHLSNEPRIVLIVDTWAGHVPESVVIGLQKHPALLQLAVLRQQGTTVAIND